MEGFSGFPGRALDRREPEDFAFWDRSGFLSPSVQAAHGTGSRRLYRFRDVVALRVAVQLRKAGVSLQSLRVVTDRLRARTDLESPMAGTYLVTDGTDVWERRGDDLVSALRQPGQGFFAFVIDLPQTVRTVWVELRQEGLA